MAFPRIEFNLRKMIGMQQGRERFDVLLTVILPLFLMVVSSYTNAWAFTGGHMSLTGPDASNTYVAICKGLFVEALVFCFFKLVKILCGLGRWNFVAALVPFAVGLFGVIVSSGCGVAWAAKSGEMNFLISSVSAYLSPSITGVFKAGVGMLFPVALAVLAVYDPKHMITEHIESGAELAVQALMVENAEHHHTMLREAQKEANSNPAIRESYKQMAHIGAQQMVEAVRDGDYSMGLGKATVTPGPVTAPLPQQSFQRIAPPIAIPGGVPQLNGPQQAFPNSPAMPMLGAAQQPFVNSPVMPANYPSMGNTQQLNIPVPVPASAQKPGLFDWLLAKN